MSSGPLYYDKSNNWEKLFRKTVMKNMPVNAKPTAACILPESAGEEAVVASGGADGSSQGGVGAGEDADEADGVVVDKEDSVPPSTRTSEGEVAGAGEAVAEETAKDKTV